MTHFKRSSFAVPALTLALSLGIMGTPLPAAAETSQQIQAELDQVEDRLHTLYSAAEQAAYDLHDVTADLQDTEAKIDSTQQEIEDQQAELKEVQADLSDIAARQYKSGGATLLSLLANAKDFSSMISGVHYADKLAEQRQTAVSKSRELQDSLAKNKAELEKQKGEQEKLVVDQQEKTDAANEAASEAQAYYDQLSDELKAKIAEEQAEERRKAEEAARAAAAEAQKRAEEAQGQEQQRPGGNSSAHANQGSTAPSQSGSSHSSSSGSTHPGNSGGSSSGSSSSSSGGASSSGGNISSSPTGSASSMVARAYSIIGSAYRWSGYVWTGGTATSAFTCSGVVDYSLGLPTNSNSPESLYASVKARGTFSSSLSKLKYGDLVFFKYGGRTPGHVGIYIGGGQMIDSVPNGGVAVRNVGFIGGFIGGGAII